MCHFHHLGCSLNPAAQSGCSVSIYELLCSLFPGYSKFPSSLRRMTYTTKKDELQVHGSPLPALSPQSPELEGFHLSLGLDSLIGKLRNCHCTCSNDIAVHSPGGLQKLKKAAHHNPLKIEHCVGLANNVQVLRYYLKQQSLLNVEFAL